MGGGRTLSFLFIFTFLVLSLAPLTISQSADVLENSSNLVQNPGFEDGLNYWDLFQYPSGWSSSSDNPHSGLQCAKFSFPGGSGYYDASIKSSGYQIYVEAGVPYHFSFWIREKDTHDTWDSNLTIVDPGIVVNGNWYGAFPYPPPSESWQFVSSTITFPESGYAVIHFQLHGYATSDLAEFAVDDVLFYLLGDCNGDGVIDVGDVVYLINYLYKNGPAPIPLMAGDVTCDGVVDVGDVVYLINYLYKGGPAPSCQ